MSTSIVLSTEELIAENILAAIKKFVDERCQQTTERIERIAWLVLFRRDDDTFYLMEGFVEEGTHSIQECPLSAATLKHIWDPIKEKTTSSPSWC